MGILRTTFLMDNWLLLSGKELSLTKSNLGKKRLGTEDEIVLREINL